MASSKPRIELPERHHAIHQTPFERALRADRLAGEEHLHRVLALQVAADRHAGRRAEESQVTPLVTNLATSAAMARVALRDELASRGGGSAVHARTHRLRKLRNGLHHAAALAEERLDLGEFLERLDLFEVARRRNPCRSRRARPRGRSGPTSGRRTHSAARSASRSSAGSSAAAGSWQERADAVAVLAQQDGLLGLR